MSRSNQRGFVVKVLQAMVLITVVTITSVFGTYALVREALGPSVGVTSVTSETRGPNSAELEAFVARGSLVRVICAVGLAVAIPALAAAVIVRTRRALVLGIGVAGIAFLVEGISILLVDWLWRIPDEIVPTSRIIAPVLLVASSVVLLLFAATWSAPQDRRTS